MIINGNKRLREIMKNETIIEPKDHFEGLGIPNSEFMSLGEFLDKSREETLAKLYALRELSNEVFSHDDKRSIVGVAYTENYQPTLALIFNDEFLKNKKINYERNIYIDEDQELTLDPEHPRKRSNGYTKNLFSYPGYLINSDTLNYLLEQTNNGTVLDKLLRDEYKETLKLFKRYLDEEVFYTDIKVCDTTGCVNIDTHHHNYCVEERSDMLIFPDYFGDVTIKYSWFFREISLKYEAENNSLRGSSNLGNRGEVMERLFIHKKLLPSKYLAKK